ncbi:MAG: type I restriction enzyme M protein [Gammaproteobacteria bacterium]|jgi:type I restriction enzyme M protein
MNLVHEIGENKCTLYLQDISQKSSVLLRLNLILNDLVHSIHSIIKGNTRLEPYHKQVIGELETFDYIVSIPPFKLGFTDFCVELDSKQNHDHFLPESQMYRRRKKSPWPSI